MIKVKFTFILLLKMPENFFLYLPHINQRKKGKITNNLPEDAQPRKNLFHKTSLSFWKLTAMFFFF